ncbi:low molecular weight protein arginine phosphatase [Cohnella pontilimi]|uniref:Low molecular weight protein arginine phosphatase n=1 Tax=Cohnella pontilimi TaxID=2564100 RepID=A0A4U0FAN9_9BACL|nr:low molecular weight protein arginine phosphatase [Cohnella pontilimi]TJY41873.1 low molecular weight protein arginine phosphatase [Cohnella pontilimi]
MRHILLVCTGNTCRSPMAESMLADMARKAGKPLEVRSAGVAGIDGYPVSPHAAETLRRRNLPVPGPSQALSAKQIAWADVILAMTTSHKRLILERHPEAAGKTYTLKEFALQGEAEMDAVAEAERLYAEWQLQQAMGRKMAEADREKMLGLQRELPDFDIADPFGGSLTDYESCAEEIGAALRLVVDKLEEDDCPKETD